MIPARLQSLIYTERRRRIVVTLSWGLGLAAILANALFHRSVLQPLDVALMFALSFLAASVVGDIGYSFLGYFAAFALGVVIMSVAASFPMLIGSAGTAGYLLADLWIAIIFRAVFPLPFLIALFGGVLGSAVGEKYL